MMYECPLMYVETQFMNYTISLHIWLMNWEIKNRTCLGQKSVSVKAQRATDDK